MNNHNFDRLLKYLMKTNDFCFVVVFINGKKFSTIGTEYVSPRTLWVGDGKQYKTALMIILEWSSYCYRHLNYTIEIVDQYQQ